MKKWRWREEITYQGRELTKKTNGREMRLEGRDYSEEMVHLTRYVYACVHALALYPGLGTSACVCECDYAHTHTRCVREHVRARM